MTASLGDAPKTATVPLSGRRRPQDHVDGRRLAGAVRPEERYRLAWRHRQVDPTDRLDRAVGLGRLGQLDPHSNWLGRTHRMILRSALARR